MGKFFVVTMDWDNEQVIVEWIDKEIHEVARFDATDRMIPLEVFTHMERAAVWGYNIKVRRFV